MYSLNNQEEPNDIQGTSSLAEPDIDSNNDDQVSSIGD